MRRITTRIRLLGIGEHEVVARIPIATRRLLWQVRWAGLVDRVRQRDVADERHTHYLHALERLFREGEADVAVAVERGLSRVEIAIAGVRATLGAPAVVAAAEPTLAELHGSGGDRLLWARRVRAARNSRGDAVQDRADRRGAATRLAELIECREALAVEGDRVRAVWGETFEECAARYTRSRFGLLGRRPTSVPEVPAYRAVQERRERSRVSLDHAAD